MVFGVDGAVFATSTTQGLALHIDSIAKLRIMNATQGIEA